MSAVDAVYAAFALPAADEKYGEVVTIAEHMLQAAQLAKDDGADDATIVASLLHDIGHLLPAIDADDRNRRHAITGADWLAELGFPETVTEPVRLHIPAKRHLVATDRWYHDELSAASVHTLRLQGGPFTADECTVFLQDPHAEQAMAVRRWDEAAKVSGVDVEAIETYEAMIIGLLEAG
ncbi:MAG: HDIG domain-containing protein [Actinomycetota bacterium]|jgi:gamma-butyrobetaine dioxygenase|nr:HDIG domain-containing protein [Actinomycetota bacterium]